MTELTKKQNDILDKVEDVIQKKLDCYLESPEKMDDKDVYNLQSIVSAIGRIQSIRDGTMAKYIP